MQFLAPLFWIGALVVAVPIFLHLTRRQTKRPIPFSSLMFLKRLPVQEIRRRKLRNPLLLFLRCLALLLIVGAFARPVLDSWWVAGTRGEGSRSVAILLDASLSMNREDVWPRAVEAVEGKVSSLDGDDEVRLIQFGTRAEVLTTWERDGSVVRQLVSGLAPSFESTSYGEALRMGSRILEEASNRQREIYLITDLQAEGLDLDRISEILIPGDVLIEVEDVGEETENLFVDEVRLQRQVYEDVYPHSVVVRISSGRGLSSEEETTETNGEVLLYLDGELLDRKKFGLDRSGVTTVTFDPFELPEDTVRGRLVLEPSDSLEEDDTYYFVLEPTEPFEVRLLSDSVDRDLFFLNALSSGSNLPFSVSPASPESKIDQAVAVLNDVRQPNPSAIEDVLERNGGVIIALGDRAQSDYYNRNLGELLPARIGEKRYARSGGAPFVSITEVSTEHPIFAPFRDLEEKALNGVQFFGYWQLEPSQDSNVLARFSDGAPALIEKKVNGGTVLLFASSLDRVWSDFPLRNAYVPFWQQIVLHAADWRPQSASLTVNQVFGLEDLLGEAAPGEARSWDLLDPTGQRLVTLGEDSPEFIPLSRPGYYEIRYERQTNWLAVNTDRVESDLTRLSAEELQSALENEQVQPEVTAAADQLVASESEPIWWMLLTAVALLILLESFVANRERRRAYA